MLLNRSLFGFDTPELQLSANNSLEPRMAKKTLEATPVNRVAADKPATTDDRIELPTFARNLQWEGKEANLGPKEIADRLASLWDEDAKHLLINVQRQWNGKSSRANQKYLDAYAVIFGYKRAVSILEESHICNRMDEPKIESVSAQLKASAILGAIHEDRTSTPEQTLRVAKELLADPAISPYLGMAIHFLKITR